MRHLPPLVVDHFRKPRNLGKLSQPSAVGRIEGRVEESHFLLYLRVEPDERVTASFELEGDRSAVAALSLLTSLVKGWPLARLRALTLEELAEALELPESFLPFLLPAHEALTAALADLDGRPDPFAGDGELVCHCLNVREGRILRLAAERDLRTLEEVREWARACTGCRSCRPDVLELLARAPRPRS